MERPVEVFAITLIIQMVTNRILPLDILKQVRRGKLGHSLFRISTVQRYWPTMTSLLLLSLYNLTLTLFSKRKWIFPERVKVGDEEIHVGVYIFVQSPPEEEDPRFPWIANVTNFRPSGNQLDILWAHHPHTLSMTWKKYRGLWEIIMSRDFHDLIEIALSLWITWIL